MALSEKQIAQLVARKDESVAVLASAFGVSPAAIRYHLKNHGATGVSKLSDAPTDAELGIGEEDAPVAADPMALLLANPELAKMVDALVSIRLAQAGGSTVTSGDGMSAVVERLTHLIEVNAQQQPGYIKPLSAEEIDRRAEGCLRMKTLLAQYEADGTAPLYLIGGDQPLFECTNAITYPAGSKIRTYLPPAESFVPQNPEAEAVYAAMFQWIGGKTPDIGDQVEAAHREAHLPPLVGSASNVYRKRQIVEAVDGPIQDTSRKRVMGTLTPERRDVSLAERLSGVGPTGPRFVGDVAA